MRIFLACLCCAVATAGLAARAPAGKAFPALLDEAMARMHRGMASAERIGDPDRDFVTSMIPHHQGAVDMARGLLLHGKDPALRRLAEGIIADQQTEIAYMRRWLEEHPREQQEEHR
ncbi:MAG TPA: DUF305 domain-containing protein [Myxococcales bacterium]|nr:MAG: DUF305 domain-containing protein [Deltaproteobacteria bacterium]HMC35576.1 DUF305 domain-containing protein [Myxococcales bacterium]